MATRNNANATANNNATDIDDIPDGLDDEGTQKSAAEQNNGRRETSAGMSLEQLNDLGFDDARDERIRQRLTPPTGDWTKSERWTVQKIVYTGDCQPGDIDPEGRTVFVVSGKPDPRQEHGMEYQPQLFLRLSPDVRYKQDKPEELDSAHKMFNKAKTDVYLAIHQQKPTKFAQLIAMLEEDQYVVRTMNGDNGPIVVDIKARTTVRRR